MTVYQILANYASMTGSAAYGSLAAIADQNFFTRNSKWFFTDDYWIYGIGVFSADVTQAQLYVATWNAISTPQIYPVNLATNAPTNPQLMDLRSFPVKIPKNEEIDIQATNGNAMAADAFTVMWIGPRPTLPSLPPIGNMQSQFGRVKIKFTVTGALTKGSWSSDLAPTVSGLLKGGVYCVVGAYIVCTAATAYRVNFYNAPMNGGTKLCPGGLVEDTYGFVPLAQGLDWLGPMGYFETTFLPSFALLANTTAGSATYTGYLDCIYMGEQMNIPQMQ